MKKNWNNPELKNMSVQQTNNEETCPETNTKCFCEHFHFHSFTKWGCAAPGYICVITGRKPCLTPECPHQTPSHS